MCLLVMAFGVDPGAPLVVAANRDERLDRGATAMTVLDDGHPRILGGRDEEAGGTWLAVNDHGLVAGLTNRPVPDGGDPAKRTRGELPLALARHRSADDAVEDFVERFSPTEYNPAWFLVGDRDSLYALDLTDGDRPTARRLGSGVHVLENSPLSAPSPKVDRVRALLGPPGNLHGGDLMERLRLVLTDHVVAPGTASAGGRRPETLAACVHTDAYGTRSSTLIRVPRSRHRPPDVLVADGHPCTAPFVDAGALWTR
ncbi:MAG TPA: NRDE family protein [Acidimicrobiales bacterium]|nr:NRDE family protein [Acidimicrobiales bacterium]